MSFVFKLLLKISEKSNNYNKYKRNKNLFIKDFIINLLLVVFVLFNVNI